LFGPDTANASDHAGSLIVSDANLLLLPVRSVAGTFAWVTSPYLLHRFFRDAKAAQVPFTLPKLPSTVTGCMIGMNSSLLAQDKVIFEDLDLTPAKGCVRRYVRW
jgi:CRISPR-associated protein Cmr4